MAGKSEGQNETKKEKVKKEVFFFFSPSDQLESVFLNHKSISKLILIGQSVESLDGIEELKHLEELWIVECGLKQETVEPVSRCVGLKRLYLYDNELTAIPNLDPLHKLSQLWLSDNQMESLQGINSLVNVRELNLGNNEITSVDVKLKSSLKITFLNLAGNPIKNMKEVKKLESLRRLRWLVLCDPLYRTSPVSLLANLRPLVIHYLPNLDKLDMLHISADERAKTVKLFDTKLEFYRLSLHNSLAQLYHVQNNTIDFEMKELELIWNALRSHWTSVKKNEGGKSNNFRFWKDEGHRWQERLKLLCQKFNQMKKVKTMAVNLEVESCGNLKFAEVDLAKGDVQEKLMKKMLSFVCSDLKENVLNVHLQNVWHIQGPYETTVAQSQFMDSLNDVFIACPIKDLGAQPLKFVHNILFQDKPMGGSLVTGCLACADTLVSDSNTLHHQLLLRSQALLSSRLAIVCGVTQPSQLTVHVPRYCGCHIWCLSNACNLVPLYIVHYQYVFQDYFKPLKTPPVEPQIDQILMPLPLEDKLSQNITELQLTAANLYKLDIPVMENVTSVDLSYNHLEDISSIGSLFPKLTSLNVAFNKIRTLFNLQGLQEVSNINLAWNFLSDFLNTVRALKNFSSLKHLDLSNNPFRDVTNEVHQEFLACKHLSCLITFNDYTVSRSLLRGEVTLQEQFPLVPMCKRLKSQLSIRWKAELSDMEHENHLGIVNDQVVSATLRGLQLTQFRSVFTLNKLKWLDLSDNLVSAVVSILKASSTLEEVNLSHNVIEGFSSTSDKFKYLTKLSLSHNYISSMNSFPSQAFPQLKYLDLSNNRLQSLVGVSGLKSLTELYLSHNCLQDPNTLVNCRDMKELTVLDMSYNPIIEKDSFRGVCLYYVNSLKYINGSKVRLSEAKNAVTLYEGLLDQEYLMGVYKSAIIETVTQLSLSNCNIKKVDLPNMTLVNLTSLTLDNNKITSLSWVETFPNLVILSLSHNLVTVFGPVSPHFSSHPSLRSLLLDHNRIKQLSPLRLDLFPNLKMLMLNNNEITSLAGLKNNSSLEQLVLDRNKLAVISCEQTEPLAGLQELYLERNSLTKLEFLRPLRKLRKLFIGHNKLLTRSSLEPLGELPDLVELTVHGNPVFRTTKSYKETLPGMPSLQLLEGHPVNVAN